MKKEKRKRGETGWKGTGIHSIEYLLSSIVD
jgi:hypothetical protein